MTEFAGRKLALLIQAVEGEIWRLRALHDERIVPEDQERLVAFENLAEDLAEAYALACGSESNLPHYDQLVPRHD